MLSQRCDSILPRKTVLTKCMFSVRVVPPLNFFPQNLLNLWQHSANSISRVLLKSKQKETEKIVQFAKFIKKREHVKCKKLISRAVISNFNPLLPLYVTELTKERFSWALYIESENLMGARHLWHPLLRQP